MANSGCPFCPGDGYDQSLVRRRLEGAAWYSVHEDKAPIVPSHRLVIPEKHVTAFAAIDVYNIAELSEGLQHRALRLGPGYRTIVFEHGILDSETTGCGVSHAHWHIVDLEHRAAQMFTRQVGQARLSWGKLSPADLSRCEDSYLFVWDVLDRDGEGFDGHGCPSQLLRRLLANAVGAKEWDWRASVAGGRPASDHW